MSLNDEGATIMPRQFQLCLDAHEEVFPKMNHGQLLVDYLEEVAGRILGMK
jgi:hypothetical protein